MHSVGIIAEYNPFHNGHAYHIERAKKLSGADTAIVCMSASFTQRGEPACLDKFTRAKHALLGGADMVIELPDLLSCACAERFAYGGVRLLTATGLIDCLAFGSECGDINMLKKASELDLNGADMKAALSKGLSYPSAAAQVMKEHGIALDPHGPNDMLAIEYLRQLAAIAPSVEPVPILRVGTGYNDNALNKGFASASALRNAAHGGDISALEAHTPEAVFRDILTQAELGRFPASLDALSPAILGALRGIGSSGISALADVSEGLENPLYRAALSSSSCTELLCKVKTKRYTLARLRRILCYALTEASCKLQDLAFEAHDSLYIRVLSVKKNRSDLLSELSERASLPVVISYSDTEALPENAKKVLEHAKRAQLLHALAFPNDRSCTDDFSHALITV